MSDTLQAYFSELFSVNLSVLFDEDEHLNWGLKADRGHVQVWLQLSVFTVPLQLDPNGWLM